MAIENSVHSSVGTLKKGQVTIFIILAIVLVIGILLVFYLLGQNNEIEEPSAIENPKRYIQSCVQDAVEDSMNTIFDNGGRINPSQYVTYYGEKYNYLCYQGDYYLSCYNTHPMLEMIIENEIREDTKDEVLECFNSMREDFEARGYTLDGEATIYSIDLLPGVVEINLKKKININRGETSQSFEDFSTGINSAMYRLVGIAREIVNSESEFCNVEYNGYMILYPQYDIRRIDYDDNKIYRVIDRASEEEFRFAVRSCAFAPGI